MDRSKQQENCGSSNASEEGRPKSAAAAAKKVDEYVALTFPQRLMEVLDDSSYIEIISWLEDDQSFMIYKPEDFAVQILPKHFNKESKYTSFCRKLNRWGFIRYGRGPMAGAYCHPLFRKGGHRRLSQMTCRSSAKSGASSTKKRVAQAAIQNMANAASARNGSSQAASMDAAARAASDAMHAEYYLKTRAAVAESAAAANPQLTANSAMALAPPPAATNNNSQAVSLLSLVASATQPDSSSSAVPPRNPQESLQQPGSINMDDPEVQNRLYRLQLEMQASLLQRQQNLALIEAAHANQQNNLQQQLQQYLQQELLRNQQQNLLDGVISSLQQQQPSTAYLPTSGSTSEDQLSAALAAAGLGPSSSSLGTNALSQLPASILLGGQVQSELLNSSARGTNWPTGSEQQQGQK
eukprot:CAMPEP_0172450316 /NCGR_PEP_ID=MMETSP1065-20121228/8709_1 /TAXON_ID=265537 /ORGANISM="Amphiprora paludosa, Strain CCMP125" /LENGTH=410 /DNA_ID=CAMNT_0013202095 /DNA_START=26 /DNA_END=1258 /DNA_ORIENTATION=-